MTFSTADLCDAHSDQVHLQIGEPIFRRYGQKSSFCGQISTLKVFEDNVLVRKTLEEKVRNRVLVIDGGGSHRCALLGGNHSTLARENGWEGIIVYGCIRDSDEISKIPIGIRALNTHPLKSHKTGHGARDVSVTFAGITFKKDHYIYVDDDGIIVSEIELD